MIFVVSNQSTYIHTYMYYYINSLNHPIVLDHSEETEGNDEVTETYQRQVVTASAGNQGKIN